MALKYTFKIILIALALASVYSCQKVVILDLNTTGTKIVIEGNVTSKPGAQTVFVSTSGDFYTGKGIAGVGNATVVIKDDKGKEVTLELYQPGIYYTYNITGEENVKYSIEVQVDGEEYTASEVFPSKKTIDSLSYLVNPGIFGDGLTEEGDTTYNIVCTFQDPPETEDYYRFYITVNDSLIQNGFTSYLVIDDELFNGQLFNFEILGTEAIKGDHVRVEMQSIGYNTYKYFLSLNDLVDGGMGSTPYNPISNMSNGALGYFGAYASDVKSIKIE